jgi:hypothetical protein
MNLWPEPHEGKDNSFDKDKVENWRHRQICSGAMTGWSSVARVANRYKPTNLVPCLTQCSWRNPFALLAMV